MCCVCDAVLRSPPSPSFFKSTVYQRDSSPPQQVPYQYTYRVSHPDHCHNDSNSDTCIDVYISLISQEEMTLRVEMEYRLLLAIDMSLYGYKKIIKIIFGGCAKFHPLAFYSLKLVLIMLTWNLLKLRHRTSYVPLPHTYGNKIVYFYDRMQGIGLKVALTNRKSGASSLKLCLLPPTSYVFIKNVHRG